VWDTETGKEILAIPSKVYRAIFSPDSKGLVTIGSEEIVRVWDLKRRSEMLQLRGHSSEIEAVASSLDGSRLASIAEDGTIKLWSAGLGREVLHESLWVWGLSVSPDGRRIVDAGELEEFTIWDAESGQRLVRMETAVTLVISSAYSPDGQRVVTATSDGLGRVWDAMNGGLLLNLEGHTRNVRSVAYAPNGRRIATGSQDGTARIWEADTGRQVHCLDHGSNLVCHVAFSPDSHRLATASELGLRMWDAESGRLLFQVGSEGSVLWRAIFSPDGKHLALIYTLEPAVRICDARTGKALSTWPTGFASVGAFSGDGQRFFVAVSGYDFGYGGGKVNAQVWDCESGRRILTPKGHSEALTEVAFTASDRRIVSSSLDLTVRQWETFPWREGEYPGTAGEPFQDPARCFADEYWRTRLAAEARPVEVIWSRPTHTVLWPRRDARATSAQLDLTEQYNSTLQLASMPAGRWCDHDDYLRELGSGLLELGGVRFDVRGVVQLRRHTDLDPIWQSAWELNPIRAEVTHVQRAVRRLHVLHGTACTEKSVKDGAEVGRFVWHYDSGQEASPILYGQDVRDWWWQPKDAVEPTSARSRVVWTGSNPVAREKGYQLRLYLTTIENPRPAETMRSLDYVSAMTESAPFLIALTVE
jgi:WD40 repeat protein